MRKLNEKLESDYNQEKIKNTELIKQKEQNEKKDNNNTNDKEEDLVKKLQKKEEELKGLNSFIVKIENNLVEVKEENEQMKEKIKILEKEKSSIKNQLERLTELFPKEINALQIQLEQANKMNKSIHNDKQKIKEKNEPNQPNNNVLLKLADANKEIAALKLKNKELITQLEENEIKVAYTGYKSEDMITSNYEEEFDLKKMVNGTKNKNRSEDLNIDYPGILGVKEKLKEVEFKYNNLMEQIKILICNINITQKIKPQVTQICQLLGYDPITIEKILNAKDKKKILGV